MTMKESNGRINILQLAYGLRIGGMEKVIQNLCRFLDEKRFNVTLCCLTKKGEFADELEAEGHRVYLCSQKTRLNKYIRGLEVGSILGREQIHILHSHNTQAFLDGFLGTRLAKTPVFLHTDHVREFPDKFRYAVAERIASHFVDEIVAVSHRLKDDLIKYEKIPPQKLTIIHNGTDFCPCKNAETIRALRDEFNVEPKEKIVGCIARMRKQKGYELFLKAAALVINNTRNTKFLIVGDGEEYNRLLNLSIQLGINSRVCFTGPRTDIERVLSIFDIFLLTSHYEGMPVCLLEAMASSIPVVATAVGGVPEVIQDGVSGYLVNSRDPQQIAGRIVTLLSNDNLRIRMGENGLRIYRSRFTVERMIANYTTLYERYLSMKELWA